MKTFLSRLTAYDWIKIFGYVAAALTFLAGPDVLSSWMSAPDAEVWSHRIGTIVGLITIVSNTLKNPSPPSGTNAVVSATIKRLEPGDAPPLVNKN